MKQELIKSLLRLNLSRTASGGAEIAIRCPFCGDSNKSAHPHFYIGVAEEPYGYHCKKCPSSGILNPEVLHRLDIFDINLDEHLKIVNMRTSNKRKILSVDNDIKYVDKIILNRPNKHEHAQKYEYLFNRTNIDFTKDNFIDKYKVIIDFESFVKVNKLNIDEFKVRQFKEAVGFLSYDNGSVTFRDTSGVMTRYTVFHLYDVKRSPYTYIPSCNVDLLAEKPTFVLAEGAFTLMGVKTRFYTEESSNVIYAASGSRAAYKRAINKLLYLTCFFGAKIFIYSDDDVDIEFYQKSLSTFKGINDITIVYNTKAKDFGNYKDEVDVKMLKLF